MATTQPPPAHMGEKAPPASSVKKSTGRNQRIYWIYWGGLFASPLTWVFALAATVNMEWFTNVEEEQNYGGHHGYFCSDEFVEENVSDYNVANEDINELDEMCSTFTAASAMQYLSIALVSVVLFLVVAAARQAAPLTGKLGIAAGITLVVFSVSQLIAFSLAASVAQTYENIVVRSAPSEDVGTGPTLVWAVMACVFGLIGATTVLLLRTRATSDQDGPFRKCTANDKAYWIYWGVLFATPLTWVFALEATVNSEWLINHDGPWTFGGFDDEYFCSVDHKAWMVYYASFSELTTINEMCSAFSAARGMQYVAIILVSVVLVLAIAAALQTAPLTGKLGLAAGATLVLFCVFELIAFSLMASVAQKFADIHASISYWSSTDFTPGTNLGWAVVAWLFGLIGAVAVLVFRARATTERDGPFRKLMSNATGANTGTPASPSAAAPAVATV